MYFQGFDSGLVKTGLVTGDTQTQWPPCGSLRQQEVSYYWLMPRVLIQKHYKRLIYP